jgi:LuxR family maltose regulon positive regulatory protein
VPPPEQPLLWLENPHATRAQILISKGSKIDVRAALKILDTLDEMSVRTYNTRSKIEVKAQRALALDALDKGGEAEAELQQALELAQPGGFIRVFVDLGSQIQAILNRLHGRGLDNDYIHRLQEAFKEEQRNRSHDIAQITVSAGSARNHPVPAETLTAREMDVLRLLQEPLSTKEIASQLYLSPSTVKRHTINLYGKLGVHSRREAVAVATTLGILPAS